MWLLVSIGIGLYENRNFVFHGYIYVKGELNVHCKQFLTTHNYKQFTPFPENIVTSILYNIMGPIHFVPLFFLRYCNLLIIQFF